MIRRPSKGTATGRVWEIADQLTKETGGIATRPSVIAAATAEGIHASTASTQYYHWKQAERERVSRREALLGETPIAEAPIAPSKRQADWSILLRAGFQYVADFRLGEGDVPILDADAPREPGVYALVNEQDVVYVGVTKRTLYARMADYRRGHATQRTSQFIHQQLKDALANGRRMRLIVAVPEAMQWNGLPIDTAAGLEEGLIELLQPSWNRRGVRG